jgi:hypothetical protein
MCRLCSLICVVPLLGACIGTENGSSPSFIGNWSCTLSGSSMLSTAGGRTETVSLPLETDPVTVSSPMSGQLLIDDQGNYGDCPIRASYNGGSASITGGTCTLTMIDDAGARTVLTLTFNGGSFNLSPDGKTMSGNSQAAVMATVGLVSLAGTSSQTFSCVPR